ncbi:MAG: hypothetical protein ACK4F9_00370 [Brevinematia bacterium]
MDRIDEEKVKKLIDEYNSGNRSVLNLIIKEISVYVYNFPIVMYDRKRDDAGEFYIYFIERIENVVRNFRNRGYKFTTYLTASLINSFKNFLLTKRKTLKVIYESELSDINLFYVLGNTEARDVNNPNLEKAVEFFNTLDEFSKLIVKVFIFELTPEDLKLISEYTGKPIEQVLKEYEEIYENISKKYAKRKKLIESINQKPSVAKLEKLAKLNTLCGYSDVAKLLNMSVSNVGVSLKRIREKFKSYAYRNLSTL